jgi:type II secretion system protein N
VAVGAQGPGDELRPLPRGLIRIGLPLAALVLVLCFVLVLFPYGRFREIVVAQLSQATGARVSLEELTGGFSVGGPALRATNLQLRWPDRRELVLEQAHLRPAWSLSWLRGRPAVHLDLRGSAGRIVGTAWPGDAFAFAGSAQGVALAELPVDLGEGPVPIEGRLDAEIDVQSGPNGPEGKLRLESADGSIALPQLPFAIPYESLRGTLVREASGTLQVRALELSGPMLSLRVAGSIDASGRLEQSALNLEVDLQMVDPALHEMVRPYGVRLDPSGAASLRISGTFARPVLR